MSYDPMWMNTNQKWLDRMPDGTIKQVNPFTGTEVWTVVGRAGKPVFNVTPETAQALGRKKREDYCHFCEKRVLAETPPEKSRMVKQGRRYVIRDYSVLKDLQRSEALFRRIPNLFEIVSFDYWKKNYDYELPPPLVRWKERYLSSAGGMRHALKMLKLKYNLLPSSVSFDELPMERKLELTNAFFGGGHEVIVARRHFVEGARFDNQLCSSGELTPEEHYQYFRFTLHAVEEILKHNRYARYVSVFQNWLAAAGASLNHLHKQLVTIDEWGTSVEREIELVRRNPNLYNEYGSNYAGYQNLVIAENDHAIVFADVGHRYPALAIYSKSERCHPWELRAEELRAFSDLVHACHAAMGSAIPCNEEWYYKPPDAAVQIPWHILIKWRVNTPAGFEGGTKIYINTIDPYTMRDQMVERLFALKNEGKLARFKIAFECDCKPNALLYNHNGR